MGDLQGHVVHGTQHSQLELVLVPQAVDKVRENKLGLLKASAPEWSKMAKMERPHKERPHKERPHKERPHKERPHKERPHKERPHPQGKAPQGKAPQGKAPQGKAPQGKAPQGKAPQGKAPQGKAVVKKVRTVSYLHVWRKMADSGNPFLKHGGCEGHVGGAEPKHIEGREFISSVLGA
jgi:hypothetical protein